MHVLIGVVAGLVVGGVLGFAFRGKESKVLHAAGSDVKQVTADVEKKL